MSDRKAGSRAAMRETFTASTKLEEDANHWRVLCAYWVLRPEADFFEFEAAYPDAAKVIRAKIRSAYVDTIG